MSLLAAGAAWILPVEVAQSWAVERVARDAFLQYEASSAMTANVWFVRCAASVVATVMTLVWWQRRRAVPFLVRVLTEFWTATAPPTAGAATTTVCRLMIVAWMALAVVHLGLSVQRRLWEWPVYALQSGRTILPNISDSNREVIRYVAAMTPAGSRIFVVSDQKLFFLSYYLLPRRMYHATHPDSEFVIPQPHNQTQLVAYRLEELDPVRIERLRPDYILEYFESAPHLKGADLYQDQNWLNHLRRRHGPTRRPDYLVALRRHVAAGTK